MPDFSSRSDQRLMTCVPGIITICRTVIRDYDFSILCGHRNKASQDATFAQGRTEPGQIVTWVKWPNSMHNTNPSLAVDLAPYPIDWDDLDRFHELAGRMLEAAAMFDIKLEWGGHWERKKDYPHFQTVKGGTA